MRTLFSALCLLLAINTNAQTNTDSEFYFGFNLMPSMGNDLITFAVVEVRNGEVIGAKPTSREQWFKLVSGVEFSHANPKLENLFITNEIDSCWVLYDASYYKYGKKKYVGFECAVLDKLWKIRYMDHPTEFGLKGWSNSHYSPSQEQFAFLRKFYNVTSQASYFYGDSMFRLLRDMNDPDWIGAYQDADLTWESLHLSTETESETDNEEDESDE